MTTFRDDVIQGLSDSPKHIPAKYFYDHHGSELFDQICHLDEYYPYRCEMEILEQRAKQIAERMDHHGCLIEFGSGASRKTRLLLDQLEEGSTYIPVDVSREFLTEVAADLSHQYPQITISPVCADFSDLPQNSQSEFLVTDCSKDTSPESSKNAAGHVIFFPGSTIGNFDRKQAISILQSARRLVKDQGLMIVGVDLIKEKHILELAYNDKRNVTAAFNSNLLMRINRELGANFVLENFRHQAFFNEKLSRIEMHLVSQKKQKVRMDEHEFNFETGESIHTESSYKYSRESFKKIAEQANFSVDTTWTDSKGYFAVHVLKAA